MSRRGNMSTRITKIAPGPYEILVFENIAGPVLVQWVEHEDGTVSGLRATQGGLPCGVTRKFVVTAQEDPSDG